MKQKRIFLSLLVVVFVVFAIAFCPNVGVEASSENEPSKLWECGKYTTLTGNVDVPEYMKNGFCGNGETDFMSENDLPDYRKNGLLVSTKSTSDVLEFKNVIDLNKYDANTQLIDIVPLVTDRFNASDFRELQITLTDADDENTWFTLHISTNDYQDQKEQTDNTLFFLSSSNYPLKPDLGKIRASIDLNAFYGVNHFINWPETNATGRTVFYHQNDENIVLPYSVFFDKDTYDISVLNGYGDKVVLYNLADSELVGEKNEFKGFKNNRVRLSVSVAKMNSSEAKYMILNVLGTGMNGDFLIDEEEPSVIENLPLYDGELPYAVVGKEYELFDVKFFDFIDGDVESKIYVKEKDGDYELIEDKFIPSKEGIYVIKYVATDKHKNEKEVVYYVNAKDYVNTKPIALEIEQKQNKYSIGQTVSIPNYSISGGSGKLSCNIEVFRLSDEKKIQAEDGCFSAEMCGTYEISYFVEDYNKFFVHRSVWVNVSDENIPVVFGDINVPKKIIDGINIILPRPNAYDFSSVKGQKLNAEYEITVSGNGKKEKLSSLSFHPDLNKFGGNITITYKIYCKAYPQKAISFDFNAIIYKPEYIYDYFDYDPDSLIVSVNDREENGSYVKFTSLIPNGNARFNFINPLRAEGFEMQFAVDENEDCFSNIGVDLYDYEDENQKVSLTIQKFSETQSLVSYGGKTMILKGGIGGQSTVGFGFFDGYIVDSIGEKLFFVGKNAFQSGKIWVDVSMNGITGDSSIKLFKLGKQAFTVRYRKDAEGNYYIAKFTDTLSPEIELDFNPVSESEWGSVVNIPYAKGYDTISSDMVVTYSLIAPDKTIAINDREISRNASFVANQYGVYILKYNVVDDANMICEKTFYINVFDLGRPVICYNGERQFSVKAGSVYTLTKPLVYDAVDKDPTLKVFLINSYLSYRDITNEESVTFDKEGYFTIRYYAYDDNYNIETVDVKIYVKQAGI